MFGKHAVPCITYVLCWGISIDSLAACRCAGVLQHRCLLRLCTQQAHCHISCKQQLLCSFCWHPAELQQVPSFRVQLGQCQHSVYCYDSLVCGRTPGLFCMQSCAAFGSIVQIKCMDLSFVRCLLSHRGYVLQDYSCYGMPTALVTLLYPSCAMVNIPTLEGLLQLAGRSVRRKQHAPPPPLPAVLQRTIGVLLMML